MNEALEPWEDLQLDDILESKLLERLQQTQPHGQSRAASHSGSPESALRSAETSSPRILSRLGVGVSKDTLAPCYSSSSGRRPRTLGRPDASSTSSSPRLGVPDAVQMACMMKSTMISGKSRKTGVLYVFETLIGFVTKAFGIKTHETFSLGNVSEVLRETFTLKKDDGGIEVHFTT